MRREDAFQRRGANTRTVRKKLLIVCEGKATEYGYFEAARKTLRYSKEIVQVRHPDATDPRSIVQAAIDCVEELKQRKSWLAGDQAWAVFDGDEHRDFDPNNWNDALQLAGGILNSQPVRVHLAISNPCFELWYLLHYQEQNANIHRDAARNALKRHVSDYEKADILWPRLLASQAEACTRAEKLLERSNREGASAFLNPSTGVHVLVKRLMDL